MQTVIRLKLDELNPSLISSIKSLYKNKEIEIIMHDVKDETEYLKENSSNHKFLLKQIAIVKKNKELKKFTVNEFIKTWIQRLLVKKN